MSTLTVISGKYQFILNSVFTPPSETSLPQEELDELQTIANNHALMIQDFQDPIKLEYFKQLLLSNPSTAYTIYMNNRT